VTKPYCVLSDWQNDRDERFTHFFPALLTYISRFRERHRASIINTEEYDGAEDGYSSGLTEEEELEAEEGRDGVVREERLARS
jgi:hypothetical protein